MVDGVFNLLLFIDRLVLKFILIETPSSTTDSAWVDPHDHSDVSFKKQLLVEIWGLRGEVFNC